ncbi:MULTISPECIES: rhodanese-like domain-containing protein [Pseudoalteromonas]|uniref:rhodanese-like domain-containing protein n=1 Tax=Pseudoalteromonas TaxID=53246 RepID=UPI000FFEC5AC|nr:MULTISPECIES: rhodanese-like domain-containing protein [Pseudoalteromonas]MCG9759676.1 rhodanese-like domain-containing protein [Pseudoalteromonas sp. Isolate6]NKC19792.1 rhodanese-like domain-containing protein [Pseudoalteromonas galatheae]RXE89074.1 rhodanese-like domain-containing protein [Pseudoalteromonas sp. A757]
MEQYVAFLGNHPVLSIIWVVLAAMLVSSWFKSKFSKIRQINPQQLTMLVNRQDGQVLDMRAAKEFNQGHIAGSEQVSAEKLKQKDFAGLEKHKSKPIILVCNTGMTASAVADNMHKAGFGQVFVLSGGIGAWQSAGLPISNGK